MIKKLFTHSAIYGIAPQIPKIATIFTLPIITQYLTEFDFGVYGLIVAIIGAISVFANLGLSVTMSNAFYKSPNFYKYGWRQVYGFLILWNIPYALILGGLVWLFIPEAVVFKNAVYIVLLNVLPVIVFGPTALIGAMYYQLKQKPFQIAIRSVIFGILGIGLTLLFIAYYKMGYMGWFLSAAITQVLLQASYWYPLNRKLELSPIFNFKRRYIKQQLKIGLPTVPHYYGGYLLNSSDRVIMKILNVPVGDIGLYNASNTVSNLANTAGTAAGQAVAPMLLQMYKDKKEVQARQLIFILQIVFLLGGLLTSFWMKEIFAFLFKVAALATVYPLGIILVMAYTYRPMYFGANSRLFYLEKTKNLPKVTLVAGILCAVLNFIFIPIYGFQVAAYTTFIGLMYMGYVGFFMKDFKESNTVNYYPSFWFLVTIFGTVAATFVVEFDIWLKTICSVVVAALGLISYKKVNSK